MQKNLFKKSIFVGWYTMRRMKKRILRLLFALEVIVVIAVYIFSDYGVQGILQLKQENSALEKEVSFLQSEVGELQEQIVQLDSSFSKEKIAREQLQMARQGDEIFYLE